MIERHVEFESAGRMFAGLFFEPEGPGLPRGAVMVVHGGAGPGAHERERARRLAGLGFVGFVPDLFGERFASRERGIEVIAGLVADPSALRQRLTDAVACMRTETTVAPDRVAAIGFCFGGLAVLELARSGAEIRGVVSLHGGLTTRAPAEPGAVNAKILVCTGAANPFVPREQRGGFEDEMTLAGADWQLHTYAKAAHGFTERAAGRPGAQYDDAADRRSWHATLAFLDEVLA